MNKTGSLISQLFAIRNRYGNPFSSQKLKLLNALSGKPVSGKHALQTYYSTLLFLIAYPDNKIISKLALQSLQQLQDFIGGHKKAKDGLYNSGIPNSQLSAAFGFEIVRWLRNSHPDSVRLSSFEADEGQIQSILSVVMRKVESEILQDGNATWRSWLRHTSKKDDDLLTQLIAVFEVAEMQPCVKDELWNALGINLEIDLPSHDCLPASIVTPYYHRSLIKKNFNRQKSEKAKKVQLDEKAASHIINAARMVLVRHLREIDPISFTATGLVSYYQLPRGLSIALMGMVADRRNPIDSYMGYTVFKNGLPIAYAGSWILFDSGRIGLNVFPAYRGGESQYIFEQVMRVHQEVYHLNRFSVDPYQIGKDNSDGIHSGAFWIYYRAGFRPIQEAQRKLAEEEARKIKSNRHYRSPSSTLVKLADSRLEKVLYEKAIRFDATDLSLVYAAIVKEHYNGDRKKAGEGSSRKLAKLLGLTHNYGESLAFVLGSWAVLLLSQESELRRDSKLRSTLKKLLELKSGGHEEDYIKELQRAKGLRKRFEMMFADLQQNPYSLMRNA